MIIDTISGGSRPLIIEISRPYVCVICKRSFGRLEHVKRHELSHEGETDLNVQITHGASHEETCYCTTDRSRIS
jgi:hypothetical protein